MFDDDDADFGVVPPPAAAAVAASRCARLALKLRALPLSGSIGTASCDVVLPLLAVLLPRRPNRLHRLGLLFWDDDDVLAAGDSVRRGDTVAAADGAVAAAGIVVVVVVFGFE